MLRLPLIVLMLTPGIAHAQKFISTADALQPSDTQVIQTMQETPGNGNGNGNAYGLENGTQTTETAESGSSTFADPIAAPGSTASGSVQTGDSIYLSETFFSEGSIENGTNANIQDLTTIEAADVVWVENGNFEAATLALGECNVGSSWDPEEVECSVSVGN